ncbi:glutamine amidotransferase-related protein, partial [Bacillus pumilus]|uniref:glutamine amidotransferase-related protein n=1 Tax=Bacillus pumilus TaxID=1408 RepID=UPI003F68A914
QFPLYTHLHPHTLTPQQIKQIPPKPIILSPPPNTLYHQPSFPSHQNIFHLHIPLLGISYRMQLITHYLAGKVQA